MGTRGPKPGSGGRPKKALHDKILEGNPGKRTIEVLDENLNKKVENLSPKIKLSEKSLEIFNQVVDWLQERDCLGYVLPQHIEEYAMCRGRWLECENYNNKSLLAKHPTTGQPIQSPFVDMSLKYLKQTDIAWTKIWDVVKENSTIDYKSGNPHNDPMEHLLSIGQSSRNRS